MVRGRWKLIDVEGTPRLYDLASDPEERHDLSAERPDRVADLSRQIAQLRKGSPPPARGTAVEVTIDRPRLEQLRALGYVEE